MKKVKVVLKVTVDDTPGLTGQLVKMFGPSICSAYRVYGFSDEWVFDSMEEAL